ncbi:PLD nuclease N-terminal domain-containing protein [Arcanobacterium hippocoleae]|uniref:PLD nuclease N-terminal domain-containing protein n=1 Tax=Arcanobacterium hippocoleae TaxID=149017 RepID=UPI00366F4BDA
MILVLVLLALIIYALIDCIRTDSAAMPARVAKPIWIIGIIFVPVLGALLWVGSKLQKIIQADSQFGAADLADKFRKGKNPQSSAPIAPDDDPDFLSRLEAQNRRRHYEQKKAEENPDLDEQRKNRDEDDDTPRGLYGSGSFS